MKMGELVVSINSVYPIVWFLSFKSNRSGYKSLIEIGSEIFNHINTPHREGFIGGGGPPSPQGFELLPTQRVPLCTILRYPFLMTNPKIFLKAHWAPIYTNF